MIKLEKYIRKSATKPNCIQTSVYIELNQKKFIDTHCLNLSELVRDTLENLIQTTNTKENEK